MAEKPIFTTPGGKKIMTLSAAKAYYESKRNPSKKGAKTFTQFIKEMKSKNKSKLPKLPKPPNKPRKLPKGPKTPSRKMYTPEQLKQLKKIHQNAIKKGKKPKSNMPMPKRKVPGGMSGFKRAKPARRK